MGRAPCCTKVGLHRGPWTSREDALLTRYIQAHGEGQWRSLPKRAGLLRCGKSCRLRWMNYLRPDIKRGNITPEEEDLIIRMHSLLGNRWSLIAGRLPGRTDNEIKNYWNTHLSKKLRRNQGTDTKAQKNPNSKKKMKKNEKHKSRENNNNNNGPNGEAEKATVYLPKPIRVKDLSLSSMIPRTDSTFTLDSINSASTSHDKEAIDQVNAIWAENDRFGIFSQDYDHDLINGSDELECHSDWGTLETLYEEYLQLLKAEDQNKQQDLDSFAESLLV